MDLLLSSDDDDPLYTPSTTITNSIVLERDMPKKRKIRALNESKNLRNTGKSNTTDKGNEKVELEKKART